MEGLRLAPDPVGKRLVHVEGLLMEATTRPQKLVLNCTINGRHYDAYIEPNRTLLDVVRDDLRLTGAKEGCGTGDCGACTMIVDGKLVTSCLMLAPQAEGAEITTIEGLALDGTLHPVQQAFIDQGAVQCGFCIPGMILAGKALLDRNPSPSEHDIREAIAGNLCRCTGYTRIVEAIADAATR
jgi:carbon-monoxide dehydrogenase small subunit